MSTALADELVVLRKNSRIGKHKHFRAANRKSLFGTLLGLSSSLGSVAITTLLIVRISFPTDTSPSLVLVTLILSGFVSAITAMHLLLGLPNKAEGHRAVGNQYVEIAERIGRELSLFSDGRIDEVRLADRHEELLQEYFTTNRAAEALPTSSRDNTIAKLRLKNDCDRHIPKSDNTP